MTSAEVPKDEAIAILGRDKLVAEDQITWSERPEHGAFLDFTCRLLDESGIYIPGLTMELAFRIPATFDACKYTFSLFQSDRGIKRRVYQLEVIPSDDMGHNGILGSHEHVGDSVSAISVAGLSCKDHEKWFRWFLQRTKIGFGGRYIGPQSNSLFA